ncbi:MAG TPA: STAS domain-containing protein, partial [Acidimicrobiales bacterium]|nr:STAS domain-containing protein [Acidimicrobiales bacterium]
VQALAEAGARSVIVDLGGAVVDAGGLNALVTASARLEDLKGELVLKSPRSDTLRLLDMTGLSNSFVIC